MIRGAAVIAYPDPAFIPAHSQADPLALCTLQWLQLPLAAYPAISGSGQLEYPAQP